MPAPLQLSGHCHCGNVAVALVWPDSSAGIPARACACSFCVKHGGVWTSNPKARLTVTIREPALVSAYAFGTRTATFHVCARCGAVPAVTSEIDNRVYAVVNVNILENLDATWVNHAPADFEGESPASRLDRRKRNWIPDVRIEIIGD